MSDYDEGYDNGYYDARERFRDYMVALQAELATKEEQLSACSNGSSEAVFFTGKISGLKLAIRLAEERMQ